MKQVKGYHGEWNMGSPGGWDYQRIAQILGKMAWNLILENVEVGVDLDYEDPQINAVPGFGRMILRAHKNLHGRNPVHAVLLAEADTLDVVLENKNFVDYLNRMEGVKASLAGPSHLSLKNGKVYCKGNAATVIFMDFNLNVLTKIGKEEDVEPIKEAIRQGILVNPRGMEPLGAKGLFEVMTDKYKGQLSEDTVKHTPWTRQFHKRSTTDPDGEAIEDLVAYRMEHDSLIEKREDFQIETRFGSYRLRAYEQTTNGQIHIALTKGDWMHNEPVLTRVNATLVNNDILGTLTNNAEQKLDDMFRVVNEAGKGAIIFINQQAQAMNLLNRLEQLKSGQKPGEVVKAPRIEMDARDFGIGAQILHDLNIHKLRLISNSEQTKRVGMIGYGLEIVEYVKY